MKLALRFTVSCVCSRFMVCSPRLRQLPTHRLSALFIATASRLLGVRDVGTVYAELAARGVKLVSQPQTYDY